MEKPGSLSKAEREMIVVATSGVNKCQYCVVAHGAILRIRAKNPFLADQVAINHRKADHELRQKAMLDFAVKVAERSPRRRRQRLRGAQEPWLLGRRRLGHRRHCSDVCDVQPARQRFHDPTQR